VEAIDTSEAADVNDPRVRMISSSRKTYIHDQAVDPYPASHAPGTQFTTSLQDPRDSKSESRQALYVSRWWNSKFKARERAVAHVLVGSV
jgi:hypothetical protein